MSDAEKGQGIKWTVTYLLLVAISGGLVWVSYQFGENTLWGHLLSELGIAGFVAFVLVITIERLSAEEFKRRAERERTALKDEFRELAEAERNAIKKDVFYQAYGRTLPQEIREELDHQVLQSDFIRSDLYLQFDLTIEKDPKTSEEYVKSICLMKSHIKNICGQASVFPIRHSIDESPSDALKDEVKYLEFQVSGSEIPFLLREPELKTMTRPDENKISLDLSKGPHQVVVLPHQPTELTIRYQGIRTIKGGGIYFFFNSHTCDLDLTVSVQNRDLEVFAEAYSPHPLEVTKRHNPGNGYYNWILKKPLLCYQAIHVTFKRSAVIQSPQARQTLQTDLATESSAPAAIPPKG
jgi:hypothetical protein